MKKRDVKSLLGTNIVTWRHRRGITQSFLSEACGISDVALSRIENGLAWPKPATLSFLAHSLGVEVHILFLPTSAEKPESFLSVAEKEPENK